MKRKLLFLTAFLLNAVITFAQCELDFGSSGPFNFVLKNSTDIVNGSSPSTNGESTQSFNIWDEVNDDCAAPGGVDDITFDFEIISAFDQYSVDGVIDLFAGSTHDVIQSSSGLRGNIPLGNSSANETSTADVRGYKITITFANHVALLAGDVIVNLTSVNTAGEAHESSSLVFLDDSGSPYGTATYDGYYMGTTGASTDASCTTPGVRAKSWSTSGSGVYTASSTVNTIITDPCNPVGGVNGDDNNDVNAVTDAGLNASDPIGGLVFTVYLEDVAASTAPGAETTTATQFTSTINGIDIASNPLPVEFVTFNTIAKDEEVVLQWTTASETNSSVFEIEWSYDGSRFETIGSVIGQGTSFQMNDYDFIHLTPVAGNNYYRLKQLDYNGNYAYSELRIAKIESVPEISVFPTIISSHVTILKSEFDSHVAIYDINGITVREVFNNSDRKIKFDMEGLPAGNYFIRTVAKRIVHTEKIMKL